MPTATQRSNKNNRPAAQTAPTAPGTTKPSIRTRRTTSQPTPSQAAEAKQPTVAVEPVPVTYYRPTVTMPDGTAIICEHKFLHESEKMAMACGRRMARAGEWVK